MEREAVQKREEARLIASREEASLWREWRANQLAAFRTWSTGIATIVRLPVLAWAVFAILRLILVGP